MENEQLFSFETVTLDQRGMVVARAPGQAHQAALDLGGGVTLELVAVPGGSFQMGSRHEGGSVQLPLSTPEGWGGYPDERPLHPVFLGDFWLGKYPVTQAQWQALMGRQLRCRFHGAQLPVETICWKEAAAFCERLSKRTGRRCGLPSEAQWEYACRAGTTTPFSFGETLTTDYANYVGEHIYRDEPPGVYRHGTTPGGAFPPNPWGLYDMHGGVWEFCADAWHPDYTGAPIDGSPRSIGYHGPDAPEISRVARGGSWHETPNHCRSAVRLQVAENDRMEYYGLRVMVVC